MLLFEPFAYAGLDELYKLLAVALAYLHLIGDVLIGVGVEVEESQVLYLLLDGAYPEAACYGRVDRHGLAGYPHALVEAAVFEGAHIVQAVGELYDYDTDILAHGKEYLADILGGLFLLGEVLDLAQLRDAVYEHGNIVAEFLPKYIEGAVGVLDHIMQERRADGIGIHAQLQQDIRHGERVSYIGFARFAGLVVMIALGKLVGRKYLVEIVLLFAIEYLLDKGVDGKKLLGIGDIVILGVLRRRIDAPDEKLADIGSHARLSLMSFLIFHMPYSFPFGILAP